MRIIIFILAFFLIMKAVLTLATGIPAPREAESILILGFLMISAYLIALLIMRFKLPKISGYLLVGIIIGPYLINFLTTHSVTDLKLIDDIALSIIALMAGGEFYLKKIRDQYGLILNVIFWQIVVVLGGMTLTVILYQPFIPFLKDEPFLTVLGVGLIFGVLSIAKSPATTIAIITETRARGRFTDFILGITVVKDVIIVLLFAIILSVTEPLISARESLHFSFVFKVSLEIILSLGSGLIAGLCIYFYLRYVNREIFLFLMGFILLVIEISAFLHLEIILIFMMAGFFIRNFSNLGSRLIHNIERNSLPIYVIFFTIAGASLKLDIFWDNWAFTLIIVIFRILTTYMGTWIGSELMKASSDVKNYGWMGFVGQAGLTLGLSIILERTLPSPFGSSIKTIVIAAIAINQILGPVLFRYALGKTGEIPEEQGAKSYS